MPKTYRRHGYIANKNKGTKERTALKMSGQEMPGLMLVHLVSLLSEQPDCKKLQDEYMAEEKKITQVRTKALQQDRAVHRQKFKRAAKKAVNAEERQAFWAKQRAEQEKARKGKKAPQHPTKISHSGMWFAPQPSFVTGIQWTSMTTVMLKTAHSIT